jgi:hypothetical protein
MFSLSIISSFKILDWQSWRDIEPETRLISRIASLGPAPGINRASSMRVSAIDLQAVDLWARREVINLLTIFPKKTCILHKNLPFTEIYN